MCFVTRNPQSPIRNKVAGFTLFELLVAIAILGILVGMASLQVGPLLSRTRLDRGARQIATDLQLVRMKAVAQNRRFRVLFRPSMHDYTVERDEGGVWRRHLLHGHETGPAADALTVLPAEVGITAVNSGGDVVFVPRGHVDSGITVTLGATTGGMTRRVVVNLAGRVRID
ncbi:MAG: GspH/FimT family pseudopilin [Candidatus Binatia bacterium]